MKLAKDMRPGDRFETGVVRTINEVCVERPTPHVHLVTSQHGTRCYSFTEKV